MMSVAFCVLEVPEDEFDCKTRESFHFRPPHTHYYIKYIDSRLKTNAAITLERE